MADTPKIDMPEITVGQSQKEVTHNTALRVLDALLQCNVKDRDLTAPPGSPSDGDTYIVGTGATGAWAGHDRQVAYYASSAWTFHAPAEGWLAYVQDENTFLVYTGSPDYWVNLATVLRFIDLSDTPATYASQAYKLPRVNGGETAMNFAYEVDLTNLAGVDVCGYVDGEPPASKVMLRYVAARGLNFPDDLSGSRGVAEVAPSDSGGASFSIRKNDVEFAQMIFAYGETEATFATDSSLVEEFDEGDILTVIAPASPDPDLAGVAFSLKGVKMN